MSLVTLNGLASLAKKSATITAFSWFAVSSLSSATLLESFDFSGGSVVSGASSNEFTSITGATVVSGYDGAASHAYSFDGDRDFLRSNKSAFNIPVSGAAAIAGWFKTSATDGTTRHVLNFEGKYILEFEDGAFRPYFDGSPSFDAYGDGYNDGQWHHFVMQNDGSKTEFYIDGGLVGSFADSLAALDSVNRRYAIGSKHNGLSNYFIGSIDEVRFYDGVLTTQEIRTLAGVSSVPPVANNDTYLIVENTPRTVVAPGVTANDYDDDGNSFTAAVATQPINGQLVFSSDGSFTYTPNTDFVGQDSFTYILTDSELEVSVAATVTLDVAAADSILTAAEIQQIELAMGVTLSSEDQLTLASIVKPQISSQWRIDAEARIEANRKADLTIEVVDSLGLPVEGATVQINQTKSAFNFSGSLRPSQAFDENNTELTGAFTSEEWKARAKELFNSVGTNNALKPRLDQLYGSAEEVPAFSEWAQLNNMGLRAHLCIWPGTADINDIDALDFDPSDPGDPNFDTNVYNTLMNHLSPLVRDAVAGFISIHQGNVALGGPSLAEGGLANANLAAARLAIKNAAALEVSNWVSDTPGGIYGSRAAYSEGWDVYEWDVINETNNNTLLMELLDDPDTASLDEGMAEMANWFNLAAANQINQDALLMLNEYQIISAKSESLVPDSNTTSYASRSTVHQSRLDRILADGGAMTGLGFQSRFKFEHPDPATLYDRLEEYATKYNLPMAGTEFEIKDGGRQDDGSNLNFSSFERAQMTEEILTTYFSHSLVHGLTVWAYVGDLSLDPAFFLGLDGEVTLHSLAWYYLHRIRYATHSDGDDMTASNGQATVRGFKGEYSVTVSYQGKDYPATAVLDGNKVVPVVLGDVAQEVAEPEPQGYLIEQWLFDDAVDTQFASLENTITDTVFAGSVSHATTDGLGRLSFVTGDSLYRNATLPSEPITTGRYEMLFQTQGIDFANEVESGQNVGFGFRDSTAGDIALIRLSKTSSTIRLEARIDNTTTVLHDFGVDVLLQPVTVRTLVDFDQDLAHIYYGMGAGEEVLAGSVTLSATANAWDQIRMVATTAKYAASNYAHISLLSFSERLPDYAETDVIELWNFDEVADTSFSGFVNSAGTAAFAGTAAHVVTNGSGGLVISQGASQYKDATNLEIEARSSGAYELEVKFTSLDFSNSQNGANVGVGLRDSSIEASSARDIFLMRLVYQSGTIRLQSRMDNTNNQLHTFDSASLSDLTVRVVVDLDASQASVHYDLGGTGEVLAGENLALGLTATTFDRVRFVAQCQDTLFGATDSVVVDSLKVSKQLSSYEDWVNRTDWSDERDTRPEADPDGDGLDNFSEFVLQGSPVQSDAVQITPTLTSIGEVPHLQFTLGADPFDVDYVIEHSLDLVDWTTLPVTEVKSGNAGDTVAVDISGDTDAQFSRLRVTPKL